MYPTQRQMKRKKRMIKLIYMVVILATLCIAVETYLATMK